MALSKVDLANMVENVAPASTIPDVNFRNISYQWRYEHCSKSNFCIITWNSASGYHTLDRI